MEEELEQKLDLSSVPKDDDDDDGKSKGMTLSYRELATATNNFRQESLIGEGGFGAVYKGQLHTTGQVVAVKKLNHSGLQGEKEFLVEVVMLSHLRHPNLVNLIGYCAEGEQRLLVYQFMPLGSLEDRLHNIRPELQPLDWNRRMTIAVGAANGLNFLHKEADPPVIYRDLKSSNILLDQDCLPKLSDFGLAKFDDDKSLSHASTTRVMGTQGYCAPEYACTGKLSTKSDIYSFGVVLLELITGRRPLDMTCGNEKHTLVDWARPILKDRINKDVVVSLADPLLRGQFSESSFCKAMEVALMCIREDAHLRPSMKDVVLELNNLTSRPQYYDRLYAAADHHEDELMINDDDSNFDEETSNKSSLNSVEDRERAVAEAKVWGESWREKGRHLKHNLSP